MKKREAHDTKPFYGPEKPAVEHNFHGLTPEFFHQIWMPLIKALVQSEGGIEKWIEKNPQFQEMARIYINTEGRKAAAWLKENCPVDESEDEILASMKHLINPSTLETKEADVKLSAETTEDQSDM